MVTSCRWMMAVLLLMVWLTACTQGLQTPPIMAAQSMPTRTSPSAQFASETIPLPTPIEKGPLSLEEALAKRRSVREFTDVPLTIDEIGQLLWAAQGVTHPSGYRTAPSAGALYPIEVYAVTSEGVYHYEPEEHRLSLHQSGDLRPDLYEAALKQETVLRAPAVFVIAAEYSRTEQKYGQERSPRYVHLEAGHAAQNLLLQATALGLGAVPIGAFYDEEVQKALSLPDEHQPLYLIPVGHPR